MKRNFWAGAALLVALCCWTAAAQSPARAEWATVPPDSAQSGVINLSHDLVRLGIAERNLPPDSPSTDARPLFQAALDFARGRPVRRITLDRGAYYFLTPQDATAYLRLTSLTDLTVDLDDSTVFFAGAFLQGFAIINCQRVTLTRLHADFISPPYTLVKLTAVDPVARRLSYTTIPQRPDPVEFNGLAQSGASSGPLTIWAMAFRDGDIVPGTSRMEVAQPILDGALSLIQNNAPWLQGPTLSTLQPGDTIVAFVRGGQATISVEGGEEIAVSDATIYGSSVQAILFNTTGHAVAERVRVMPRRGGLIATNAGGIIFVNCGADSHLRNSYVARSLDDALAMYETDIATVAQQIGRRQLTVDRIAFGRFPNGTKVNFVDSATGGELGGATIVSQQPPDSAPPIFGGAVTVSFDADLPTLTSGFGMALSNPASRGAGSSIERNVVRDILFGRGVYATGNMGLTVADNEIGRTSDAGIGISQNANAITFVVSPTPPAHDLIIRNNIVRGSLGLMASGAGSQIAVGAIMVATTNAANRFPASSPNTNISIERNTVLDSGRTGIWVNEVAGGAVRNNVVRGWNQHPELPLNGVDPQTRTELLQDFTQALVVRNSQNLEVRDNVANPNPLGDDEGREAVRD